VSEQHSEHHIVSPTIYFAIFGALMICTVLTVVAAEIDLNQYFGGLNIIVALTIAVFKASLVVLFFMHVYWSTKLNKIVVVSGIAWLGLLLWLTVSDFATRGWLPFPGK